MAILMDDPTTYLVRDTEDIAIVLAGSVANVMELAKQYGVSIQVNMAGGLGIRVVTNHVEAIAVIAAYPADTPWTWLADGLTDKLARDALYARFGPPTTAATCFGVETVGRAWRQDTFRYGP